VAFEAVLLEQGVLSPADVVESLEADEPEDASGDERGVLVTLESGDSFVVTTDGVVVA
jgi:hypothetical protein